VKLLDRYVAFTFLKVFLGALLLCTFGIGLLDFFTRLGQFLDPERLQGTFAQDYSSLRVILEFYAAYLPFLVKEMLPFITVAAALLTLSTMLRDNEILPVMAAGVSARRLFLPLFLCGLLVAAGHMAFQDYLVPTLGRKQLALKRFFAGDRTAVLYNLSHLRDGKGTVTCAGAFFLSDRSLFRVVIQRPWTEAGFERVIAKRLVPDGDAWIAPEGGRIEPAGVEQAVRKLPPGARVEFGITPAEVEALATKHGTRELSYSQLSHLVRKFPGRRSLQVALHKQIARPLTSFAILLCGVPILLAAGSSFFLGGALAFLISAGFYFLDIFFTSLGARGDLPPLFAAYFPLVLLVSIGVSRLVVVRT